MDYPFLEILSGSVLITGLVIIMMMLIECLNVWSSSHVSLQMKKYGPLQVVVAALLGAIPGCMGGFAVVSLYTHGMISFGALIAMMIASSGDEAFVMLAMVPKVALVLIPLLTVLAIVAGLLVDVFYKSSALCTETCGDLAVHKAAGIRGPRHFGWKRVLAVVAEALFLAALALGFFEEEAAEGVPEAEYMLGGINLLSEDWMNAVFIAFGLLVLVVSIFCGDHFFDKHLVHHIVSKHLPKIFLWTFGTLSVIALLMHFVDISSWISNNVVLMVLLAAVIGIIPESGPHLVFVTMFASGIVPLPVLVASCISQDGHSGLPLLAESRKTFLKAKLINVIVAIAVGLVMTALTV